MKNLETSKTSKLLGISKAHQTKTRSMAVGSGSEERLNPDVKSAFLEAERKKAGAITILRRYTIR
jgi:hypothetical protein